MNGMENLVACCGACNGIKGAAVAENPAHGKALVAIRSAFIARSYVDTLEKMGGDIAGRLRTRSDRGRHLDWAGQVNLATVVDVLAVE